MRFVTLSILMFLSSCAVDTQARKPSSQQTFNFGKVDVSKSLVQIFPSQKKDELFYLYVQLKDVNGKFVDCGPEEFSLKTSKGKNLSYSFERSLKGHYFLTIDSSHIDVKHIGLFVQNRPLKEQFKLHLGRPDPVHTKMKIIKNVQNTLSVELLLRDKENKPVELPERPEILLEGTGHVENVQHIGEGIWHFEVNYPEENQIMYFSVRAMGVKIPNLYRYQHVEK